MQPSRRNGLVLRLLRQEALAQLAAIVLCGCGHACAEAPIKPDLNEEERASASLQSAGSWQESSYGDRTDAFEKKLQLLEAAWQSKDYDLARALTHSLKTSVLQAQAVEGTTATPLLASSQFHHVDELPDAWRRWAQGWKYFKSLALVERGGMARRAEPCETTLGFPAPQVDSCRREIRVAQITEGQLKEVPSQAYREVRRGDEHICSLLWLADSEAHETRRYLVFYGNADAELPEYPSDLKTNGEGIALQIENAFFKAALSSQTGQLQRLTLKREHGMELFSGGEGHGEPAGIDWAHDYVSSGNFQKFRISLWDQCPDYEVVRGPLCTIVRRWGFPYSPVHPLFSPSRLHISVEYRFYAGLPWFHKIGAMQAVQDFEAAALRDDEWVFSGYSFTDALWIGSDGKLRIGAVDQEHENDLWGVGFFNRASKDSFIALFLEHAAEGIPELVHGGAPMMSYRWHGSVWSRYPLPMQHVLKGTILRQKNAYVSIPFTPTEGPAEVEALRRRLIEPLVATPYAAPIGDAPQGQTLRLARPGEAGDSPVAKSVLWEALGDCKDAQLYTSDVSVVDLGLIYDVRVRGDVVTLVMAMPHRGRPLAGYFTHGSISVHPTLSVPIRERLLQIAGVREVVVEQTWEPSWNANMLTDAGRKKLGL